MKQQKSCIKQLTKFDNLVAFDEFQLPGAQTNDSGMSSNRNFDSNPETMTMQSRMNDDDDDVAFSTKMDDNVPF